MTPAVFEAAWAQASARADRVSHTISRCGFGDEPHFERAAADAAHRALENGMRRALGLPRRPPPPRCKEVIWTGARCPVRGPCFWHG
ncbi:MAG: hypothetical protein Q8Q14_02690 [Gemmatimonadales bacterium]|nr:hypothetical protein [Gemmatimonadales bacterium]